MEITMDSQVIRSQRPVIAPVDDELVMADIDAGEYYGLNDIAAAVWENLEAPITVKTLCLRLCERFDVSAVQCAANVLWRF